MADFTLSDYKLQAYLLANAKELIEKSGRDTWSLSQYVKKLEGSTTKEEIAANALNPAKTVDFVSDLPDDIMQKLKLDVKVYKVFIVDGGDQPSRELPILLDAFDAFPDDGGYRYLNRADLSSERSRKRNPGDPGVQIENIEIVRLGGNPAEIDTNITVKISLFATSLQQYFLPYGLSGAAAIVKDKTLPKEIRDQAAKGVSWIDLIKINLEDGGLDPFANLAKKYGIDTQQGIERNVFGSTLAYNSEQQRIKLQIGYREGAKSLKTLVEEGELEYTQSQIDEYKAQIQAQTEVYYLNLQQNAFTFNSDDGSVQLQIDYVASTGTATIDRKNDLLFDPYLYEKELQANDAICKIQKNIDNEEVVEFLVDPFGSNVVRYTRDGDNHEIERTPQGRYAVGLVFQEGTISMVSNEEQKKEALTELDALKKRLQVLQANKLINGLYAYTLYPLNAFDEMTDSDAIKKFSRTYLLFVPAADVTGKIVGKIGSGAKHYNFGLLYKEKISTTARNRVGIDVLRAQQSAQSLGTLEADMEKQIEDDFENQIDGDEVNIEYVFFGDLIETAFEILAANNRLTEGVDFYGSFQTESSYNNAVRRHINDLGDYANSRVKHRNYTSKNVQFFVTPFYAKDGIDDPRIQQLYKEYGEILLSNITYKNPADVNQEITISLADVPISTIEFKKWFTKNISTKRKRHLFMKDYIESLVRWVSRQIGDAVAADQSTTTDLEPPQMLVNRYFLNVDKYDFLPLITNSNNNLQYLENRISITELSGYVDRQAGSQDLNSKVLTIIGQTPSVKFSPSRAGVKVSDRDDKIPHILFADPDKGMLYNIQFQREDMPGLREARLFEGKDMYGLEILREKYNATLEFYGNNFFKPGTMIYIDPGRLNVADFGYTQDNRSPARLLGLGGYHLVIRVTHDVRVADNAWRTMVDTQWQTFGADDGSLSSTQEEDCITSITARLTRAIDLSDSGDSLRAAEQMVEDAAESGLVEQVEEVSNVIQEDAAVSELFEAQTAARLEELGIED